MSDSQPSPERANLTAVGAASPHCVHHWLLGEPAEGTVTGLCKRCGGQRAFPANPDGTDHLRDVRELAASLRATLARQTA